MAEGACEGVKAKNRESVEGDGAEVEMWVGGWVGCVCEWKNNTGTQRPNYLGKRARAQNQTLCHWDRSIGGGLRSVFGASSSSRRGGSGGLQGKERQTDHHCYSTRPCH